MKKALLIIGLITVSIFCALFAYHYDKEQELKKIDKALESYQNDYDLLSDVKNNLLDTKTIKVYRDYEEVYACTDGNYILDITDQNILNDSIDFLDRLLKGKMHDIKTKIDYKITYEHSTGNPSKPIPSYTLEYYDNNNLQFLVKGDNSIIVNDNKYFFDNVSEYYEYMYDYIAKNDSCYENVQKILLNELR